MHLAMSCNIHPRNIYGGMQVDVGCDKHPEIIVFMSVNAGSLLS
jgi:hypothetical protein